MRQLEGLASGEIGETTQLVGGQLTLYKIIVRIILLYSAGTSIWSIGPSDVKEIRNCTDVVLTPYVWR
jgi:hypothetical protein